MVERVPGVNNVTAAARARPSRVDTLDGFIREMKIRFPDATARAPLSPGMSGAEPVHTGSLPAISGIRRIELKKQAK